MKTRISNFIYPPSINRCQHIKVNGVQCGSPSLKNRKLCHFHQRWQQGRIQLNANRSRRSRYSLDLPILEDANSIQVALMQGVRLLLTDQIDHKKAALLFYALQTASTNLRRTKFEPLPEQVVIDPRGVRDTSLGDNAWYKAEFEEEEESENENEKDTQDLQASAEKAAAKEPGRVNLQAMAEETPELPVKPCRNSLPIAYETRETFFGGEQTDSNQRLIYTWAWASPQKWRASGWLAAVRSQRRTVRF